MSSRAIRRGCGRRGCANGHELADLIIGMVISVDPLSHASCSQCVTKIAHSYLLEICEADGQLVVMIRDLQVAPQILTGRTAPSSPPDDRMLAALQNGPLFILVSSKVLKKLPASKCHPRSCVVSGWLQGTRMSLSPILLSVVIRNIDLNAAGSKSSPSATKQILRANINRAQNKQT
jgi:hypothetical protein